jgi:hypothetical protein
MNECTFMYCQGQERVELYFRSPVRQPGVQDKYLASEHNDTTGHNTPR